MAKKNANAANQDPKEAIVGTGADTEPPVDETEDENEESTVEVKQAVINPKAFRRIKVPGLTGSFGKATFGDDNITIDAPDKETAELIYQQFGDNAVPVK
jgi:hypothetical protein